MMGTKGRLFDALRFRIWWLSPYLITAQTSVSCPFYGSPPVTVLPSSDDLTGITAGRTISFTHRGR